VPIVIAIAIAVLLAPTTAMLIDMSARNGVSTHGGRSMAFMMVPLATFGISEVVGANAFIAAYLTGFGVGHFSKQLAEDHALSEVLEVITDFLSNAAWFLAGELLTYSYRFDFKWEWVVMAILALTVMRIVPVFMCLLGTGLDSRSCMFIGWFGPRGLATVIFSLFVIGDLEKNKSFFEVTSGETLDDAVHELDDEVNSIVGVLLTTVLFSVVAHGVTAGPLADAYSHYVSKHPLDHAVILNEPEVLSTFGDVLHSPMRQRGAGMHRAVSD
jgi:NhaP-type Na+/H+ or K+/H+ antiporter